ncbi:hypothetical protein EV363DRAFT_1298187 [Boletus edulis]|nr:hypothetical protein EV363DRAFT_1298187 [Boletus edulis]
MSSRLPLVEASAPLMPLWPCLCLPPATCAAQPFAKGLGLHFESPTRPHNKRKTQTFVHIAGQDIKRRCLIERLQKLQANAPSQADQADAADTASPPHDVEVVDPDFRPADVWDYDEEPADSADPLHIDHPPGPKHHILPDQSAQRLYHSWKSLIPTIIPQYLSYVSQTLGKPLPASPQLLSVCHRDDCMPKTTSILALFFDYFAPTNVVSCQCSSLSQVLVYFGLFPTAPSQSRMAVSIDLLAFYCALFERSCDAINALSSALHNHYVRRGFRIVNNKVCCSFHPPSHK